MQDVSEQSATRDVPPRQVSAWRRVLSAVLICAGTLLLLIAAVLGAFGIVVGRVPEYRVQVQEWVSDRAGLDVEFRALSARLRFFGPELVFEDAVVRTPDRSQVLATAQRGSVGFDIWSSIRNGQLSAGRFALYSPQIALIRTREGRIQLLGQSALPERNGSEPIAIEQLPTGQFTVVDAVVSFRDEVTGRGPWSMSGVSFELARTTDAIELRGGASLPEGLGRELKFSATAEGRLHDPHAVVSRFSVSGEALDLAGWADVFPDEWPAPETGRGSLQISGALQGARLTQLTASVDFRNVATALPMWSIPLPGPEPMQSEVAEDAEHEAAEDEGAQAQLVEAAAAVTHAAAPAAAIEMVSYERIALVARAKRTGEGWQLTVSDLDVSRVGAPWRAERIEAAWSAQEDSLAASVDADRIVLGNVWPVLAYLPESPALARLRALDATGTVESLSARFERIGAGEPAYSLKASLQNVGFRPIERAPGLRGISGELELDERRGSLDVEASDVEFELPRMFRHVLSASTARGRVAWERTQDGVRVTSDELRVAGADGRASASLQVFVPRDGSSPILELSARGEDLDAAATGKYVPGHKLSSKTLDWFDRAFVAGRVRSAQFDINGPTRSFPFRNGEGTFTASAQVQNATLAFHEDWMPATEIDAELSFRNQGMTIQASAARIGALAAQSVTARIADFKDNDLRIATATTGDLRDALEFLRASPLAEALGPQLERIEGEGGFTAELEMRFPIKRMQERDVKVAARVANATVRHLDLDEPIRELQGSLIVRNTLVTNAALTGRWLGGPVAVDVEARDASSSTIRARGEASAAQLRSTFNIPPSVALAGTADWRLTTLFPIRAPQQLHVSADLRKLAVELPHPVGKREGEPGTLDVDLTIEPRREILARATLGDLRALIRLNRANGAWKLDRGGLRADAVPAALPSHSGLRIEGAIDRFVLDDWLALKGSGTARPLSAFLQGANVRIGRFEAFGYRWSDLRGILQAAPSGWRIDVSGPEAVGQILLPESFSGNAPLRAAMERLVLTKVDEGSGEDDAPTDPRRLPNLDVHVRDLHADGRAIGAVDLVASRVPLGLRIDEVDISGTAVRAEGRGQWLVGEHGVRSTLTASITSSDVAATLASLNYTPFLEAKLGEIRASLSWPGGYDGNILERASGTITVRAEGGQIVNLQPGAGRVLGLFSVAALPRRLALDFSDLTDKGLAFDTIHGDFDLRDGNAYTNNLLLRGPAAEIGIAGRTGFGTRDYDQTAVVTGNLGASLPVAGALAGGPAVGAALLLFSQVFKEPLKGMTRGYYRITGPWDNPNVERVEASAAKDATARTQPE